MTAVGDSVPKPLRFIRFGDIRWILKNDDISAAAYHRFISQLASGRSSALSCLAAVLVLSEIWRLLRLHGLFFGTDLNYKLITKVLNFEFV